MDKAQSPQIAFPLNDWLIDLLIFLSWRVSFVCKATKDTALFIIALALHWPYTAVDYPWNQNSQSVIVGLKTPKLCTFLSFKMKLATRKLWSKSAALKTLFRHEWARRAGTASVKWLSEGNRVVSPFSGSVLLQSGEEAEFALPPTLSEGFLTQLQRTVLFHLLAFFFIPEIICRL